MQGKKLAAAAITIMAAFAALAPGVANATVFSGSTTFAASQGQPSLNGPTPDPAQTSQYFQTVSGSYDSEAGTVTISFGWFDPATWGEPLTDQAGSNVTDPPGSDGRAFVSMALGYAGDAEYPPRGTSLTSFCNPQYIQSTSLGGPVLTVTFYSVYTDNGPSNDPFAPGDSYTFAGNMARFSLDGYTGTLTAPVSFDGTTFTATIQDPHFVGHIWDCLTDDAGGYLTQLNPPPPPAPQAPATAQCKPSFEGMANDPGAPVGNIVGHHIFCQQINHAITQGRLVGREGHYRFRANGFRCQVLKQWVSFGTTTGESIRCTASGKSFRFSWAT